MSSINFSVRSTEAASACLASARCPGKRSSGAGSSLRESCQSQSLSLKALHLRPKSQKRDTLRRHHRGSVAILEHGHENMYEAFNEDDAGFVNASLLHATEVKSGPDGFLVRMTDGTTLRCKHNKTNSTKLPDYAAQPAIVLKLEDGSDLLLPLIVLETPRAMLLDAMKNVPLSRPTMYQVIRNMIEVMGYELKLVRVTHRVCDAYYANVYISKVGDESGAVMSFDLRPSDAVNLAVRSKVPIQVNKALAVGDGVRQIGVIPKTGGRSLRAVRSYHFTWTEQDRPDAEDQVVAEEFALVQLMERAAIEERFADAAKIRDQLMEFRQNSKNSQA